MLNTYLLIFGALILAGGIQGLLAGSKASIIAASILGGLVIAGALLQASSPTAGNIMVLVGAIGIAGKFVPGFLKAANKGAALWPAGVLGLLSIVALVWVVKTMLAS